MPLLSSNKIHIQYHFSTESMLTNVKIEEAAKCTSLKVREDADPIDEIILTTFCCHLRVCPRHLRQHKLITLQ